MDSLNDAKRDLEAYLSEEQKRDYFALLRQWFMFSAPLTKEAFDQGVRKFLTTEEQIRSHNYFLLSILSKISSNNLPKTTRTSSNDRGIFEIADYADYVQPSSPNMVPTSDFENRSAASELFLPDTGFMACKIALICWKNKMEGAEDNVTDLMVHACQVFIKNIITAMITKKKGYKVRDQKLQYGFNQPIPNPFIRNFNNIIDDTQESKVEVANDDDALKPKCKRSLEDMEQQIAFSYSCTKRLPCDNYLTVGLLYETIKEDPKVLGLHSMQSMNLFRLGLQLTDEDDVN
ncbi:unnamed protein product [Phaedon cochleariae]|uniref:Transcriptional adapter 1-like protein n=1 Tax=Phaedon cochleariae TaxID=80249 RepID=A0A9P0DTM9_PHACE|nr:unnamed protein product [Phaedon cochleariae]